MGKGSKSNKSSKKQAEAPKCTCDHPFNCSCGNRPPRPSRGHKWDPETQQWGGKGHKQKGASGQIASVSQPKKTLSSGTEISQWEKLPSQLLDQVCQKQGRPNAKYKSIGNCKYRVIVQDAKVSRRGTDHDLFFVPKAPAKSDDIAKEEAALLALLHLTPTIPHERKLPEPYKTTWLQAVEAAKQSKNNTSGSGKVIDGQSNNDDTNTSRGGTQSNGASSQPLAMASSFASAAERRKHQDAKRREHNARIRRHEAIRLANRNHQVFMSAKCRQQIESLLRGDSNIVITEEEEDEDAVDEANEVKTYVVQRLHHEGFTIAQARRAFGQLTHATLQDESEWDTAYEECLQWLCIHLNEDQLPEGFDPRGRTLDVVVAGGGSNSQKTLNKKDEKAESLAKKYGISEQEAAQVIKQATKSSVEDELWAAFCRATNKSIFNSDNNNDPSVSNDDEIEALQAIFSPEECVIRRKDGRTTILITIPSDNEESFTLEIVLNENSYPFSHPERVLVSGGWPSSNGVGTSVHIELARFVGTLPKGEPMIYEIFGQASSLIHSAQDGELEPTTFIPSGENESNSSATNDKKVGKASSQNSQNSAMNSIPRQKNVRRPREKAFFWSKTPQQTPAATAFPNINPSLDRQRKSLPAAKARGDILAVLKQADEAGRVVLVTGDTGK